MNKEILTHRVLQFGLISMVCMGTVLTEGTIFDREAVFGFILLILAGCGWIFQDVLLGLNEVKG